MYIIIKEKYELKNFSLGESFEKYKPWTTDLR